MENTENKMSWSQAYITPEMSLANIVNFFNILNERLCNLENIVKVRMDNGEEMSLSDFYSKQMEEAKQENENKGE